MKDLFNKIINSAKTFSLTGEEKKEIISKVSSYMKENPISTASGEIVSPYSSPVMDNPNDRHMWYGDFRSGSLISLSILRNKKIFMPIIILLMVMLGGGASLAANSALPGDTLYPVKNVNEKFESFFAVSANEKAKVEADFANTRLEEAEKVARKGELSSEAKEKIKDKFAKHAEKTERLIAALREKGEDNEADEVSSDFESALEAHHEILARLSLDDDQDREAIAEINFLVDAHLKNATRVRSDEENTMISSEDQASVQASAEASLNASNNKITEVEKYINNKKEATAELKAKATAKLNTAKDTVTEGKAKLEAKAYGEAFVLFQKARRIAQEAKLALNSEHEFKIDLNGAFGSDSSENDDNEANEDKNQNDDDNDQDSDKSGKGGGSASIESNNSGSISGHDTEVDSEDEADIEAEEEDDSSGSGENKIEIKGENHGEGSVNVNL